MYEGPKTKSESNQSTPPETKRKWLQKTKRITKKKDGQEPIEGEFEEEPKK